MVFTSDVRRCTSSLAESTFLSCSEDKILALASAPQRYAQFSGYREGYVVQVLAKDNETQEGKPGRQRISAVFVEGSLEATDKTVLVSLGAYRMGWRGEKVDGKDTVRGNVALSIV